MRENTDQNNSNTDKFYAAFQTGPQENISFWAIFENFQKFQYFLAPQS